MDWQKLLNTYCDRKNRKDEDRRYFTNLLSTATDAVRRDSIEACISAVEEYRGLIADRVSLPELDMCTKLAEALRSVKVGGGVSGE